MAADGEIGKLKEEEHHIPLPTNKPSTFTLLFRESHESANIRLLKRSALKFINLSVA